MHRVNTVLSGRIMLPALARAFCFATLAGIVSAPPVWAAEYAILSSGFRLRVAGHERVDGRMRLTMEDGGVIEMPSSEVVGFQADDYLSQARDSEPEAPSTPNPLTRRQLDTMIDRLASEHGLPPDLLHSLIAAESNHDPRAVSRKGAAGLMQLMPETARDMAVANRFDPEDNLTGGTAYLLWLLDRYEGEKDQLVRALAAYNAGPGAVERHGGLPPYNETRAYVRRVLESFLSGRATPGVLQPADD